MKNRNFLVVGVCLAVSATASADIYKCIDGSGKVTYTNANKPPNASGCSLLSRDQNISTLSFPKKSSANAPTPSSFPKVDDNTQKSRDDDRRKILEQELSTEEKALEDAKKELAQQEEVRYGNEKNYQKKIDRVKPYQDKVALHERNIEALRKEIANLK